MTEHMQAEPGRRFEYVITDQDRWLRQPDATLSVQVRQAPIGEPHSASTAFDFTIGVDAVGLWWDTNAETHGEYLPLLHELGDWDTPTDAVAEVCAVLDRLGFTDATDR